MHGPVRRKQQQNTHFPSLKGIITPTPYSGPYSGICIEENIYPGLQHELYFRVIKLAQLMRKLFLKVKWQLINVEWMIELENHQSVASSVVLH